MAASAHRPSRKATTWRRRIASTVVTISTADAPTRINELLPNTNAPPSNANGSEGPDFRTTVGGQHRGQRCDGYAQLMQHGLLRTEFGGQRVTLLL
jgi:hypothetical protein